jgi:Domain of unknown function (DUF4157)
MAGYAPEVLQQQAAVHAAASQVMPAREPLRQDNDKEALQGISIQRKLSIGAVDDPLENEADAMAGKVMRMPEQPFVQRKCARCDEEEQVQRRPLAASVTPFIQAKGAEGGTAGDILTQQINATRGSGSSMDRPTQSFMESRFGTDFSNVKIHTGDYAVQMSRELNAQAFTVGSDIYFSSGKYNPSSDSGKHLLAHELTHTVQQGAIQPAIQRSWEILPRTTANPLRPGGRTDEQLLERAFADICPLTSRSGNFINMVPGPAASGSIAGCSCLRDIEAAIGTPALTGNPTVRVEPNGWSSTTSGAGALAVSVRHPDDPFEWGYWTGSSTTHPTETRHIKPFWQTLAHEVCGHGATYARSGGTRVGSRSAAMGHNDAIIGENAVAAEHGVVPDEQRGLDFNPATGTPMTGHRGESFLQATVRNFAHGSAALPATAAAVVTSVVNTINTTASSGLDLFIQVEGLAFASEGGAAMAASRAAAMRTSITGGITAAGISLTVGSASRFHPDQATALAGSSSASAANPARSVRVYLFHRPHSAGP